MNMRLKTSCFASNLSIRSVSHFIRNFYPSRLPAFPTSGGQGVVRNGAPPTRASRALRRDAARCGSS